MKDLDKISTKHRENKSIMKTKVEFWFDLSYLIVVIGTGSYFLVRNGGRSVLVLYGIMALVLGIGDSFHLVPRMVVSGGLQSRFWEVALGYGKMITSITMTLMYLLLFYVWKQFYGAEIGKTWMEVFVWVLVIVRIVLCLFPQNAWLSKSSDIQWPIYRNLPFFLLGAFIIILFLMGSKLEVSFVPFMPLAVFLSFAFYLPVALFANKKPLLGMLMLPKTIMYIWIACMGFTL